jgi:hypothetical protein
MPSAAIGGIVCYLRRGLSVLGIVSLSVMANVLVQQVLAPAPATAQPSQSQEVRAERFILVATNGTELARLEPGGEGNGRLRLFEADGTLRLILAGQGALTVVDSDGEIRFRAGYIPYTDPGGRAPINGVWLDEEGSSSLVPPGTPGFR